MPDHIHFIIHLEGNVDKPATLAQVVGAYKSIAVVSWLHYIKTNEIHAQAKSGKTIIMIASFATTKNSNTHVNTFATTQPNKK